MNNPPFEIQKLDREQLGILVREIWRDWARQQKYPKDSWLTPWTLMHESDKEVDRLIGEGIKKAVLNELTYKSDQATSCAVCSVHKHTPLRNDEMGGYVCLTCVDKELSALQVEVEALQKLTALQHEDIVNALTANSVHGAREHITEILNRSKLTYEDYRKPKL